MFFTGFTAFPRWLSSIPLFSSFFLIYFFHFLQCKIVTPSGRIDCTSDWHCTTTLAVHRVMSICVKGKAHTKIDQRSALDRHQTVDWSHAPARVVPCLFSYSDVIPLVMTGSGLFYVPFSNEHILVSSVQFAFQTIFEGLKLCGKSPNCCSVTVQSSISVLCMLERTKIPPGTRVLSHTWVFFSLQYVTPRLCWHWAVLALHFYI